MVCGASWVEGLRVWVTIVRKLPHLFVLILLLAEEVDRRDSLLALLG